MECKCCKLLMESGFAEAVRFAESLQVSSLCNNFEVFQNPPLHGQTLALAVAEQPAVDLLQLAVSI